MQFAKTLLLSASFLLVPLVHAQTFDIVDGHAKVVGKPNPMPGQARENWVAACDQWKNETMELNKTDHVMMISCEQPTYTTNEGNYTYSSDAKFTVKTSGVRASAPPPPPPSAQPYYPPPEMAENVVVEAPPPAVIVETVPAPRPGFIWIGGFWGWRYNRHYWYPGRWETHRPGYFWVGPRWAPRGRRWAFEPGRWRR